jgi:hypothetical protein
MIITFPVASEAVTINVKNLVTTATAYMCRRAAIGPPSKRCSQCWARRSLLPAFKRMRSDQCYKSYKRPTQPFCPQALGRERPRRCRSKTGSGHRLEGVALLLPLRAVLSGWVSFEFQLLDLRGFVFLVPLKSGAFQGFRYRVSGCWDQLTTVLRPEETDTVWKLSGTATAKSNKRHRACCSIRSARLELVPSVN